jgi:serine/threonine protein phosphatase PrpC
MSHSLLLLIIIIIICAVDMTPREPEACFCTVQGKRPYQEDQYAVRNEGCGAVIYLINKNMSCSYFTLDLFFILYSLMGRLCKLWFQICPFLQDVNNPGVAETHFYGVFDGHAGGRCSKAIATAIPINLAKDDAYKTKLIQAIKRTISRTNDQFLEIAERMRLNDGSTGVFCVLREGKLVVANVGDSRAIMVSNGKSIALTKDHKPSAPEEQRRIASFGGVITNNTGIPRVQGVLAVSRAYGNCGIRNYIRADPDIITRDLGPDDDFIVIASDGLWVRSHSCLSFSPLLT